MYMLIIMLQFINEHWLPGNHGSSLWLTCMKVLVEAFLKIEYEIWTYSFSFWWTENFQQVSHLTGQTIDYLQVGTRDAKQKAYIWHRKMRRSMFFASMRLLYAQIWFLFLFLPRHLLSMSLVLNYANLYICNRFWQRVRSDAYRHSSYYSAKSTSQ